MQLENLTIDGINIGIYKDGPVGVGVSCGADSAIVLYILMKNVINDLHIYNLIGDYRKHALEEPFDNVVAKCAELTGKTNYFVHKTHVPKQPPELIFKTYEDAVNSGEVNIVYTGLTMFPPDNVFSEWKEQLPSYHVEYRKESNQRPLFGIEITIPANTDFSNPPLTIDDVQKDKIVAGESIYSPFINHNKQDIAKLYRALGVEDTLLPVTRSCENDNHPGSHCGECWWCKEREWGFGHL